VIQAVAAVFIFTGRLVGVMRTRRTRRERWEAAAAAVGLTDVELRVRPLSERLRGRFGPLGVSIQKLRAGDQLDAAVAQAGLRAQAEPQSPARVTIGGLPRGLGLAPRTSGPWPGPSARGQLTLGDPAFDDAVYVHGPSDLLLAIFDAPTRAEAVRAMALPAWVEDGTLTADCDEVYAGGGEGDPMPTALRLLLGLCRRLERPPDLVARLAAHAREEPLDAVRLGSVKALARGHAQEPAAQAALRLALADRCADIRLEAAIALGDEGHAALFALARDGQGSDACAGQALHALGERLGADEVRALLGRSLAERRVHTARACIGFLGRHGNEEAIPVLAGVLAVEKGELAEAAVLALGTHGQGSAEAALVKALRHPQAAVGQAAAEALGRIGSPAVVIPLREMEARHPGAPELRRAVDAAVAAIQARTGGGAPGQVSIAGGDAGQLSIAPDAAGRVSLPEARR